MPLKSDRFSFAFSWNSNKCLGFQKRRWPLAWSVNSEYSNEWKKLQQVASFRGKVL